RAFRERALAGPRNRPPEPLSPALSFPWNYAPGSRLGIAIDGTHPHIRGIEAGRRERLEQPVPRGGGIRCDVARRVVLAGRQGHRPRGRRTSCGRAHGCGHCLAAVRLAEVLGLLLHVRWWRGLRTVEAPFERGGRGI